MIVKRPFPDALALLPSETYIFDQAPSSRSLDLRIVGRKRLANGVEAVATNIGLLAFDFKTSELGGFQRFDFRGSGAVPQEVTANTDEMIALQQKRLRMAMFVTACIYGVHAKSNNTIVNRPLYPGLDDIYGWIEDGGQNIRLSESDERRLQDRLGPRKANLAQPRFSLSAISSGDLSEGFALADRLLAATPTYAVINPISAIVMTYQAMVLHARQHAGASIALSAVVAESAVAELIFGFGLVSGTPGRLPLPPKAAQPSKAPMSRSQFKELRFGNMVQNLKDQRLLDAYLALRIDDLRHIRNDLMHESKDADPRQSGNALTVVRDLLWLCSGERGFELNTSWTYRC